MDSNAQPSLSQIQLPSKFDDVGRMRQRMDDLRKHHNESSDIHNRTQPILIEKMHEDTMKFIKSGQVNGAKTKNQKPRVPKKQRNTANTAVTQTNPVVSSTTNELPPQPHVQPQQQPPPPPSQVTAPQHSLTYSPHIQQHPMHMQQSQQHFTQHRFIYQQQQSQQQTMQNQMKQPHQHQMYPQHQMHQQISSSHVDPQYVAQHYNHHSLQHHHHHHLHHHQSHYTHAPFTTLPNDLDLNLQAGLECDVDSLIKHEMSVEGQLDFNHDLIQRILF